MSWLKKGLLVMQTVEFMAQLFRRDMPSIGSLYFVDSDQAITPTSPKAFTVGETVLLPFFKSTNIKLDILRGPFITSADYIAARIALTQHFASKLDLVDDADIQSVSSSIQSLLPTLFPITKPDRPILYNRNISTSNILVDPTGSPVSICD
jgi:hypothetical protein